MSRDGRRKGKDLLQTEAGLRPSQESITGSQTIHPHPIPAAQSLGEGVTFLMKSRRTFWSSQL